MTTIDLLKENLALRRECEDLRYTLEKIVAEVTTLTMGKENWSALMLRRDHAVAVIAKYPTN